jgi:8-oxo-dGTP diphosphatase
MKKLLTAVFPLSIQNNIVYILLGQQPEGRPLAGFLNGYGGKVEIDESTIDAAYRELDEEAGINQCTLQSIGIITHSDKEIHCFVTIIPKLSIPDSQEMIHNTWYPLNDDSFVSKMLPGDDVIIKYIQENQEALLHQTPTTPFTIQKFGQEIESATNLV